MFSGLKCYNCVFWDGPSVPHNILHINHQSCGIGNNPESRFIQECESHQICAATYVEFNDFHFPKSISSRSCIQHDSIVENRCTPLKTLADLNSLYESSRIVKFGKNDEVKDGTECGCEKDLCNSSSALSNFVWIDWRQF